LDTKAFIRELLFGHDCVIIPGFGGFIGNFSPARINKTTGTFYPPLKQVSFNRNLNHNDGLLISKISRSMGVNYGDARHLVEEFVKELTGRLARGEKVVFDHIGTFVYNRENNVQFEPEARINYYTGSFGLESFQCVPVRDYDVRKRITRHIDKILYCRLQHGKTSESCSNDPHSGTPHRCSLKTDLFKARLKLHQ
jgi:nucleoid DNA-binding protein